MGKYAFSEMFYSLSYYCKNKKKPTGEGWFLDKQIVCYLNKSALMVTLPPFDCHSLVIWKYLAPLASARFAIW